MEELKREIKEERKKKLRKKIERQQVEGWKDLSK